MVRDIATTAQTLWVIPHPPGIETATNLWQSAYRRSFNGLKVLVFELLLLLVIVFLGEFFANTLFLPFIVEVCFLLISDVFAVGLGDVGFACVDIGVAMVNWSEFLSLPLTLTVGLLNCVDGENAGSMIDVVSWWGHYRRSVGTYSGIPRAKKLTISFMWHRRHHNE